MNQAKKTLLSLLALVLVAGGFGLYAFYGVQKTDEREAEKKDHDDRLFTPHQVGEKEPDGGAPKAEFTRLSIAYNGETTQLEREVGKDWRIVAPVQAPADKMVVDGVVSQLQQSKFKSVIEESPDAEAIKKYGLDTPKFTVEASAVVGDKKEARSVKLVGGIENTYDGSVYMQRGDGKTVYAAEGGVRWSLQKSTFDLRDKQVVKAPEPKVLAVEVKTKNNQYVLGRDADKRWRVEKPAAFDADPGSIAGALGGLDGERALSFPAETAALRKLFEAPTVDATITLEGESDKARVRIVKLAADAGDKTYLLREQGSTSVLVEVSGSAAGHLDRNPNDLRDKTVLPFKKEQVAKVVFKPASGDEIAVQRDFSADGGTTENWRVTAPRAGAAKGFKLSSLMWTVGALKASQLGEEHPKDWSKYGLDSKSRAVSLFDAQGKSLGQLLIGKDVPGKAGQVYMRGRLDQVVEVDSSRLNDLPATAEDLLDLPPDAGTDAGK